VTTQLQLINIIIINSNSCINLRFQRRTTNNYLLYRTFGLGDFQQIGNTAVVRATAKATITYKRK